MSYLSMATKLGCAYTSWGPCFCNTEDGKCKSCISADKIDEIGLDWDEEFKKAEMNGFADPDYTDKTSIEEMEMMR